MSRSRGGDVVSRFFFEKQQAFKQILERLSVNDSELTHVDLKGFALFDRHIFSLCRAMRKNTVLKSLDLSFNQIGSSGAQALFSYSCASLTELDLSNNEIEPDSNTTAFAHSLEHNRTIKTLDLSDNTIDVTIASAIGRNKTIESLSLRHNHITIALVDVLSQNIHLKTLDLSDNQLNDGDAQRLSQCSTLKSLILEENSITTVGARALLSNARFTHLGLRRNTITHEIIDTIQHNTTLVSLDIKENRINKRSIKLIKDKLLSNQWDLYDHIQALFVLSSALSAPNKRLEVDIFHLISDYLLPEIPSKKIIKKTIIDQAINRYKRFLDSKPTQLDEPLEREAGLKVYTPPEYNG